MKKGLGFLLITISVLMIFSNIDFNVTGNATKEDYSGGFVLTNILGIIFLIGGVILLMEKKGLEYLVIPTGWEEPRIEKAKEELDKRNTDKIIITGNVNPGELKGSHRQRIYKQMREYGLKPSQMKILDGIDSEEDILFLYIFRSIKQ